MKQILHKYKGYLVTSLALLLFLAGCIYVYDFYIDDTFISLRYAQNLVNSGQLSYNPGEAPVEGYSNFLLVLLEALLIKLGVGNVLAIPKALGILAGAGCIILIFKIANEGFPKEAGWVRLLPVIALAVNSTLIVWAIGGLETDIYLLMILGGVYWFIKSMKTGNVRGVLTSDLFFLLACLTRPDGVLIWGLGYLFLLCFFTRVNWRSRLCSMGISGVLFGAYLLWKYFYFGDILPTTFYSKVGQPSLMILQLGISRYFSFLKTHLHFLFFILLFVAAWEIRNKAYSWITYLLFIFFGYSFYLMYLGNPVMNQASRFYAPVIPILYLLGSYGFWTFLCRADQLSNSSKTAIIAIMILVQAGLGGYQLFMYQNVNFEFVSADSTLNMKQLTASTSQMYELADWVYQNLPPGSVAAAGDIGVFGYFSNARIIDTWSLINKKIIEFKKEQSGYAIGSLEYTEIENKIAKYILDQNPAVIMLDYVDYSSDVRSENYFKLEDFTVDDKHLFIRKDLLDAPPGPKAYKLSRFRKRADGWSMVEG